MIDLDRDLPLDEIAALCRRYRVRQLALFGSALRDDFDAKSDYDILVEFDPAAAIGIEFVDLQLALEDLLGRPVDLVSKRGLRAPIRDDVLASARTLYAA